MNWGHTHFRVKIVTMMKLIQEDQEWCVGIDSQLRVLPNQHLAVCLVSAELKRAGTLELNVENVSNRLAVYNSAKRYLGDLGMYTLPTHHRSLLSFKYAKDLQSLSLLVRAFEQMDHQRIGEVLDFPLEARMWFHPENRNGIITRIYLRTLDRNGVSMPSWIPYCPFVVPPHEVLRNGECARIGRQYEQFAFDYDRKLALAIRDNYRQFLDEGW